MRGPPTDFWGKLDRETGEWHPLIDHCADVAAVVEALLERTLMRRRLARLAEVDDLSATLVGRLGYLAALHDLGKFNLGFQARWRDGVRQVGHVKPAIWLLGDPRLPREENKRFLALLPQAMRSWGGAIGPMLMATYCHHGTPYAQRVDGSREHWRATADLDPWDGLQRLLDAAVAWFPGAFEGEEELPTGAAFQHGWNGLLTLADWLGSDGRFFPFRDDGDDRDRMDFARPQARRALREVGLEVSENRRALEASVSVADLVGAPVEPRPGQKAVAGLPAVAGGSITVLEASTGSGKTEAALLRFLDLLRQGEVDGLYFALPTRTAATQIHRRVTQAMARVFGDTPPAVVQAVPGYLKVDDMEGERSPELPRFEVLWPDDAGEQFRHRAWAAEHPKRYLAGVVVVGTIDQVLLSTLQVRHAHLRATPLLRHLLVVDEVHASDVYMTRLLQEVLKHHQAAGGHAFLMSATLGGEARAALIEGRKGRNRPGFAECAAVPYPVLSHRDGAGRLSTTALESHDEKTTAVQLEPTASDPAAIAALALGAAAAGARVLVVRNTVGGCLELQAALEEKGPPELLFQCAGALAPHHSRFAREDRQQLDAEIEEAFDPKRSATSGLVVAATQTVEQSLDLDADLLITDLCPMDVLLQRIGRLHRHARDWRPAGFERPRVIVLVPAERDLASLIGRGGAGRGAHGLGTVYEDLRVLEATWRQLEKSSVLTTPACCRELVEATTHHDALQEIAGELEQAWKKHQVKVYGGRLADASLADLNLVKWDKPFGELLFPPNARVPTRLGESDLLVELPRPVTSPFGQTVRHFAVSPYLLGPVVGGEDDAAERSTAIPEVRLLGDSLGTIEFSIDGRRLFYDRLGLRPSEG